MSPINNHSESNVFMIKRSNFISKYLTIRLISKKINEPIKLLFLARFLHYSIT